MISSVVQIIKNLSCLFSSNLNPYSFPPQLLCGDHTNVCMALVTCYHLCCSDSVQATLISCLCYCNSLKQYSLLQSTFNTIARAVLLIDKSQHVSFICTKPSNDVHGNQSENQSPPPIWMPHQHSGILCSHPIRILCCSLHRSDKLPPPGPCT